MVANKNIDSKPDQVEGNKVDPLVEEVYEYLTKFDFPLAQLLQRKFKIGFSRAERILKLLEAKRKIGKL